MPVFALITYNGTVYIRLTQEWIYLNVLQVVAIREDCEEWKLFNSKTSGLREKVVRVSLYLNSTHSYIVIETYCYEDKSKPNIRLPEKKIVLRSIFARCLDETEMIVSKPVMFHVRNWQ